MKHSTGIYKWGTLIMCLIFLTGCRKGKEDPFISLRSRTKRITGDWKLIKVTGSHSETRQSDTLIINYEWDFKSENGRDSLIITASSDAWTDDVISIHKRYECRLTMNKDNSANASYAKKVSNGTETWDLTGNWMWNNEKGKKKQYVSIEPLQVAYEHQTTYEILGLKNDWMKLKLHVNSSYTDDNGDTQQATGAYEYVFEKSL